MKKYTLGFIFDNKLKDVVLINKIAGPFPGKLNGIGGNIEETDDGIYEAMYREMEEETWFNRRDIMFMNKVLSFKIGDCIIHVFYITLLGTKELYKVQQQIIDEGIVGWYNIKEENILCLNNKLLAPNVAYFVSKCLLCLKQ